MRKYILYILLALFTTQFSFAEILRDDTSKVDVRTFDEEKIKEFQKDPRYDYKEKESWLRSLWNRFWDLFDDAVNDQVKDVAKSSGGSEIVKAILIILAIVALVFGLTKVKFRTWISGKGATVTQEYEVEEENIHEIDFDKDIKDAEKDGDYRRAVRLLFLRVLKNLSDGEHIYWDPNKTNHQYMYELKGTNIYSPFTKCVNVFDWVWYGEWKIDESYYHQHKPQFEELMKGSLKIKTAVFNG
jgi:hypothetical protein